MILSDVGKIVSFQGKDFIFTQKNETGFALFGPYETFAPGQYSVVFKANIPQDKRDLVPDSTVCCMIDVVSDYGLTVHGQAQIFASMLKFDDAEVNLDFELDDIKSNIEFRFITNGTAPLLVQCKRDVITKNGHGGRFKPILEYDSDPHDQYFEEHFSKFLELYRKGAKVTPTTDGTIIDYLGIKINVNNIEDHQIIWEILEQNVYNFNTNFDVCVIDIGMNVGLASLYFAKMPRVKFVHSFEPFRAPFERAKRNFALNPYLDPKIRAHNFGLGANTQERSVLYDETTTISVSIKGIATGKETTILLRNASEVFREIISEVRPLGLEIVVKMDCEGSEFAILEALDADGLLPEIRIFMIEWHKWWSPEKTQQELISRLMQNGLDVLDHTNPFAPHAGALYAIRSIAA